MKIVIVEALDQNTFVHDFDLKNDTLQDIRQWLQSSIKQKLPFSQYKFAQRCPPYHRYNMLEDELVKLDLLNIKFNNESLFLVRENNYDSNNSQYNKWRYIVSFLLIKIYLLVRIVWDYIKCIDREKMDYILVDSNSIDSFSSISHNSNNKLMKL